MRILIATTLALTVGINATNGAFVTPQIGGGQVGLGGSIDMIHISVKLSSNTVVVTPESGTSLLRPLEEPDEFDSEQSWGVLGTKAYNFQYGWLADNSGGDFPPIGAWFWIEQISATPGLEVYQRPPASPSYDPIFGTAGASTRWYWSGVMSHNVYAVQDPSLSLYEADYRVYIGNEVTGEPLPGYTAADVTLRFNATPILTADFDGDDDVDDQDRLQWEGDFMLNADSDSDSDGDSDGIDFLAWQREFGSDISPATAVAVVPEPSSISLVIVSALTFLYSHRRQGGLRKA